MSTSRKALEKMSSPELEKYIQPGSRFVPEAIKYASEILETRGRTFNNEETERINKTVSNIKKEETVIHPNHIKASQIMYLCGALGIGSMIWTYEQFTSGLPVFIAVAVLAFIFGIGYLIGQGNEIAKYILIITFALGIFAIPSILSTLTTDPVLGIINILQTILQVWAIILLLKIPTIPKA